MELNLWITVASGLAGLNVLLLAALSFVWLRNYRQFGSPLVLGLLAFAVVMLVENLGAIYFSLSMAMLYATDPMAQQFVIALRALETVALAVLTYVTWQ